MMRSLWTAASGMAAQQLNIDTTANNLSNVNTVSFKQSRAEFEDLMYQTLNIAGRENQAGNTLPTGLQVGMGVKPASAHKFFEQGDFQNTGNPLDLAIEGDGFFQVEVNGDLAYTRAGNFKLDQDGQVVTSKGNPLQPPFNVPPEAENIEVTSDGRISALNDAGEELAGADIPVYTFVNPAGLNSIGGNLYLETEASGAPQEEIPGENNAGTIEQGFLEMSNVELVEEMVKMITAQRAYESNSKAITSSDEMLQTANQISR
ncbi:MAG: flagellar basal-body rod protein FlgG [Thermodesulfobacteriota bacterium]